MALPAARGAAPAPRPVVIRKVKKGGHGHHGGSWKVAYADFVTAMMAFFLLMWLLASTESEDRAAIASYFQRPLSAVITGSGTPGGDRIVARSVSGGEAGPLEPGDAEEIREALEAAQLEAVRAEFEALAASSPLFAEFEDQIAVELTGEGLRVQLTDEDHRPMFAVGSAVPQPYARDLLREIARVFDDLPNRLAIAGHTDAMAYAGGEAGYSNWELSADRANAARRVLVAGGVSEGKVLVVEGLASSALLTPADPYAPANRRITVLLLTREAAAARTPG